MSMPPRPDRCAGTLRAAGFTLIELLVVIGILALLITALAPAIFSGLRAGDETETEARMTQLVSMIEAYERHYGTYPSDDFTITARSLQSAWELGPDNGKNTGIESLVQQLHMDAQAGGTLDEHEDWLANTDGDKAPKPIPQLERRELVEVLDAWGTPFIYFSGKYGSGMTGQQTVKTKSIDGIDGIELVGKPVQNPRTGGPLGAKKYQLLSAGADLQFGTEDDIVYPELPQD